MVDIRDLLAYNVAERHVFFKAFAELSWDEFTKNREASFHSIRNIFIHTLNATEYWLDILQEEKPYLWRKFEEYGTLKEIEDYMQKVENRMNLYLTSLSLQNLKKEYKVSGRGSSLQDFEMKQKIGGCGKLEMLTAEDILVHIFEEEVHHRGELMALFWQMGIEPPVIGYPTKAKYLL